MRERLIEIVKQSLFKHIDKSCCLAENITDDLLNEGVIVPPCKVGDKVFVLSRYYTGDWKIYDCTVNDITIYKNNTFIRMYEKIIFVEETTQIGKTVFLTREEAEKALKGGEGDG